MTGKSRTKLGARPFNETQHYLVGYFHGGIPLSDKIVETFLVEHGNATPNLSLIRKYYNLPAGFLHCASKISRCSLSAFTAFSGLHDDLCEPCAPYFLHFSISALGN